MYADDAIFAAYDPNKTDLWSLANTDDVNGGINHFGSPFNFPEEFVTVYRLHPMVPDLIEYREWDAIRTYPAEVPVVDTLRGNATQAMRERGLANWALSMGRQRLGLLTLQNHPQFPPEPRACPGWPARPARSMSPRSTSSATASAACRASTNSAASTVCASSPASTTSSTPCWRKGSPASRAERLSAVMREIYGQHKCDASKIITEAQMNADGEQDQRLSGQARTAGRR